MKKRISIIGAGISGLVTAKTLLEYGHEVEVFEKDNELGGVWASSRHYPGMTTQNTKDTYFFSDFPMPKSYPEFPTANQVLEYLKDYATKFELHPHIFTGHCIEAAVYAYDDETKKYYWQLRGHANGKPFTFSRDYLIICNGTFSDRFIPQAPGMDLFTQNGGLILHTTQVRETNNFAGKRVAVIGYGKSACDTAAAIAPVAKTTHLVYREAKWKVPKKIKGINYKYILLSRFGEALTKFRYRSRSENVIHSLGMPKLLLGTMQRIFAGQQRLKKAGLMPEQSIKELLFGELSIESDGFFNLVINKKIQPVKAEVKSFEKDGINLSDNTFLPVDTVIYGTGFSQSLSLFSDAYKQKFTDAAGNYLLYRNILPVDVPALAFNGYNSSFFCTLTSEIAALWLAEYLEGNIGLPEKSAMLAQVKEHIEWRGNYRVKALFRNATVWPFNLTYVDWLLGDMNSKLSAKSMLSEWLTVVNPANYAPVKKKILDRTRKNRNSLKVSAI